MPDKESYDYKNGKRHGDWSCKWGLSGYKQFYINGTICGHYQYIVETNLINNEYHAR
jgi:hypothetical protein